MNLGEINLKDDRTLYKPFKQDYDIAKSLWLKHKIVRDHWNVPG